MLTSWGIVCMGLIPITYAKIGDTTKPVGGRTPVGRFSIPIHDDQIGDWEANKTLQNHLVDLLDTTFDFWFFENFTLPPNVEAQNMTHLAKEAFTAEEFALYGQPLLDLANQTLQADISFLLSNGYSQACSTGYLNSNNTLEVIPGAIFQRCYSESDLEVYLGINASSIDSISAVNDYMNETFFDFASEYVQAVYNTSMITQFYNFGALMGVGRTVECSDIVNTVLESKNAWTNAGSSAATTLMALLPTFLAFGNLYVPRSSEVFATSSLVGISSSLYSFGLPVSSLSVIPNNQNLNLATFGLATLAMIASFASIKEARKHGEPPKKEKKGKREKKGPLLEDLQKWSEDVEEEAMTSMDEAKGRFAEIRSSVILGCHKRWHWWYLPSLLITSAQAIMFGLAIFPLLNDLGTPRFLFTCYTNWTGAYLAVTASINAVFRFLMWEVGYHERVLIYALSPSEDSLDYQPSIAEKELQKLLQANSLIRTNSDELVPSMQTELPPLYPPLMTRVWASWDNFWLASEKNKAEVDPRYLVHLDEYGQTSAPKQLYLIILNATKQAYNKNVSLIKHMWSTSIWRATKGTSRFFGKMFRKNTTLSLQSKAAAIDHSHTSMRYRPLVVLIHLSTAGRNFAMTLTSGFVEASLYLVLTFFLASQWGGNLLITGFALSLLLIFTTAGRALGLVYVWISTKFYGLNVINCDSHDEILGSLRIVCSMREVLVCVNGASYYNGYRLNGLTGFREWQKNYDTGVFDHQKDDPQESFPTGKYMNTSESDTELGPMKSPRVTSSLQVDRNISTRYEIQTRTFARMTADQSESRDNLFDDQEIAKIGFGVSASDVYGRANSADSRSNI